MQTTQTRNRRKRNVKKKTERRERGGVQKRGRERRSSFFVRRVCFLFFFFFSASSISSQLDLHKILKPQPRRFRLLPPALPPSAPLSTPSRWPSLSPPRAACPRAALVSNETARGSGGRLDENEFFSLSLLAPLASLCLALLSAFSLLLPSPSSFELTFLRLPPLASTPHPHALPTPNSLAQVRRPGRPPHRRQGLRQVRKGAESPLATSRRGGTKPLVFFALVVVDWSRAASFFGAAACSLPYPVASLLCSEDNILQHAFRSLRGSISSPCRLRRAELA